MYDEVSSQSISNFSPILDDQPAENDHLGFNSYVEALYDSILDEHTKTPLILGIFGRWGTGKTTLMKMLERKLNESGTVTVWFNAWQYSKENELWAAFLQSVINKVQEKLNFFQRVIFKIKLLFHRIEWQNVPGTVTQYLLRFILVLIPVLVVDPLSGEIQPDARPFVQAGGAIVAAGLAILLVVKPLLETVQESVTLSFDALRQDSDYQKHIAFLDKFREHFADVVKSLPQRKAKRLTVFIDDLDRCSSDQVLQVLDAVKLFIDISGCVYVLGLDIDIAQEAVSTKYKNDPTAQKEYLGKIVQLPFHLPPLTRQQMILLLNKLSLNLPDSRCQEVFVTGLLPNPREMKRTINVFSLLWNLVQTHSVLLSGNIKPVRLAKVVVVQHGYPELHKLLQQRPDLLIVLERYFRQEQEYAQIISQSSGKTPIKEKPTQNIMSQLLQLLIQHFNEDEIRDLCFYLNVDYEVLPGEGKTSKARELILYLERHDRVPDLVSQIQRLRPTVILDDNIILQETLQTHVDAVPSPPPKPEELESFTQNDRLRRMLLLHDPSIASEDVCNFVTLDPADVEEYFTLTSRAEAPSLTSSKA